MTNIEEFKKKNKPTSKLLRFKSEIFELLADGYSLKQIQRFLEENDIKITSQAIGKFVLKNVDLQTPKDKKVDFSTAKKLKKSSENDPSKMNESERAAYLIERLGG